MVKGKIPGMSDRSGEVCVGGNWNDRDRSRWHVAVISGKYVVPIFFPEGHTDCPIKPLYAVNLSRPKKAYLSLLYFSAVIG